jgi:cell division protein FtsZ
VIHHVAEERTLAPIVDPWVEEFESDRGRRPAAATPADQGDLYMERSLATGAEPEYAEPVYDDRDHRKSGWSLFGSKKPARPQPTYVQQPAPQMRSNASAQPMPEPQPAAEDDLEIPSFLRRLAN